VLRETPTRTPRRIEEEHRAVDRRERLDIGTDLCSYKRECNEGRIAWREANGERSSCDSGGRVELLRTGEHVEHGAQVRPAEDDISLAADTLPWC